MSYIQIEIGGRLRGLKFNIQLAKDEFLKNLDFGNYFATVNYAMVWAGLYANAYVKRSPLTKTVDGKEVAATFEDVCEWADAAPQKDLDDISYAMNSTDWFKALVEVAKKADEPAKEELPIEEKKSELATQ